MAHLSGKDGILDTGTAVSGIKSWTLDYTSDALETTDFADGATSGGVKTYIIGCKGWSGSFEGYKEGAPQGLAAAVGDAVTLSLKESTTATQKWVGSAFIIGIHASAAVDGIVSYSYDFQGTAALSTLPTT